MAPRASQESDASVDKATQTPDTTEAATAGKGAPTPSRKEAERARMERLHPVMTKKEQRNRERQARMRKRDAQLKATEERPERVLLRNNVDSHWSIAEFAWPVILLLLASVLASSIVPRVSFFGSIAIWIYFVACGVNLAIRWFSYKRELAQRMPDFNTKGKALVGYMMSRMITMRRFRNPGPVIKRGEKY